MSPAAAAAAAAAIARAAAAERQQGRRNNADAAASTEDGGSPPPPLPTIELAEHGIPHVPLPGGSPALQGIAQRSASHHIANAPESPRAAATAAYSRQNAGSPVRPTSPRLLPPRSASPPPNQVGGGGAPLGNHSTPVPAASPVRPASPVRASAALLQQAVAAYAGPSPRPASPRGGGGNFPAGGAAPPPASPRAVVNGGAPRSEQHAAHNAPAQPAAAVPQPVSRPSSPSRLKPAAGGGGSARGPVSSARPASPGPSGAAAARNVSPAKRPASEALCAPPLLRPSSPGPRASAPGSAGNGGGVPQFSPSPAGRVSKGAAGLLSPSPGGGAAGAPRCASPGKAAQQGAAVFAREPFRPGGVGNPVSEAAVRAGRASAGGGAAAGREASPGRGLHSGGSAERLSGGPSGGFASPSRSRLNGGGGSAKGAPPFTFLEVVPPAIAFPARPHVSEPLCVALASVLQAPAAEAERARPRSRVPAQPPRLASPPAPRPCPTRPRPSTPRPTAATRSTTTTLALWRPPPLLRARRLREADGACTKWTSSSLARRMRRGLGPGATPPGREVVARSPGHALRSVRDACVVGGCGCS